jgi:malonate decarboxylase gamma subunit
MLEVLKLCDKLFPKGHDVTVQGHLVRGSGLSGMGPVAVVGTCGRVAIGVDLAFSLAAQVLDVIVNQPRRPILMLVDTQGQQLSRRDELLGNAGYLAHLAKCFQVARARGHLLLSLVHGEAVSGGFLSLGMIADRTYALKSAQIRVMALPAMSRITQIPLEDLEHLCESSAIFGPGVDNYFNLGAIEAVWDVDEDDVAWHLDQALATPGGTDTRARQGMERGGRALADRIIATVVATHQAR